jgi:colicin import membrane protein
MNTAFSRKDPRLGAVLVFSTILHAAFYFMLSLSCFNLQPIAPEQVCYVDVVNLPVANPRAGSPAATGAVPAPPPAVEPQEMKLPAPSAKQSVVPKQESAVKPAKPAPQESASEFEDRIAKLARDTEERRQAAALAALRQKVTNGAGRAGMPSGTGTEAGSDYASYIQSRLYDAFKLPPNLAAKDPQVLVLLTITKAGKVAEYRIERSTGGKAFEDAVARAIVNAERTFRPPPNSQNFTQRFVFTSGSVGTK